MEHVKRHVPRSTLYETFGHRKEGGEMPIQTVDPTQKRLRILGDDEIEAIYGMPRLTHDERMQYFSLSQPEKDLLQELRSVKSQVYFVLQLGYFKSKYQFFVFGLSDVKEDVQYVLEQHFDKRSLPDFKSIDKSTRLRQQRFILELYNYRLCNAEKRQNLMVRARQAAMISAKPVYIFRDLMTYLTEQRIVAPGYSLMHRPSGFKPLFYLKLKAPVSSVSASRGSGLLPIAQIDHEFGCEMTS